MDMDLDITLDVNAARLAHARWELELERLVTGGPASEAPHIHADCDLKRWIYARGLHKYGQFPEMWDLKEAHNNFHAIADEVARLKLEGQNERAMEMLDKMRHVSREVVYLLTGLELSVLHHKQHEPVLIQAWHVLGQFFGGDTEPQPLPMLLNQDKAPWYALHKKRLAKLTCILDINAARLNHVMWVRNLKMAFTRLSWGKYIQSEDECSLGTWIHAIGRQEFAGNPKFEVLDKVHLEFHNLAIQAVESLHRQDFLGANSLYKEVIEASHIIVLLLTHLELNMQDSQVLTSRMKSIL